MVMKKNMMRRNLWRSIRKSMGRYIAIMSIIALGAGLFVGLLSSKISMMETASNYMDTQNMYDLTLLNDYGWSLEQVEAVKELPQVVDVEGTVYVDVIGTVGESQTEAVYEVYSIPQEVNQVYLLEGRMPEAPNECLADANLQDRTALNDQFRIADTNEAETLESLNYQTFTIVGYVSSPLFMDMNRNNTTLGNGSVTSNIYIPWDAFDVDYYSRIDVTVTGDYEAYTDAYHQAMDDLSEEIKPQIQVLAQERYESLLSDGWEEYNQGLAEYEDGLKTYNEGKQEAEQALLDAKNALLEGEQELEDNQKLLDDGAVQLQEGLELLERNKKDLEDGQKELDAKKQSVSWQLAQARQELEENEKTVNDSLAKVEDGLTQLTSGLQQLDSGILQMELLVNGVDSAIRIAEKMIADTDNAIALAQEALDKAKEEGILDEALLQRLQEELDNLVASREWYIQEFERLKEQAEPLRQQLDDLKQQRDDLQAQKTDLESTRQTLLAAQAQIEAGYTELENQSAQAQTELANAQKQIDDGNAQLEQGQKELEQKQQELESGRIALEEGRKELEQGWEEYRQGEADTRKELEEGYQELEDARVQLEDAKATLEDMKEPSVYILTRESNAGYLGVSSNSDIVAGVSRVFPAFFLLVAALVCITTMTRMVEEERTQIGTLKALGYGNGAIIGKYLFYAGSAAVLGCGIGVVVGSIVFPQIIWTAYSLILTLKPNLDIVFNIPLCVGVVAVYTALMLLVTWYSCRVELREVPAELVRPKTPAGGKKILLEYIPLWKHLRFLDKVMLRNIFRYRQRLLMMIVGICGCTALLVTGFGIGDSIKDIVSYQFEEVTLYDLQVQFGESLTPQDEEQIEKKMQDNISAISFVHQSTADLEFGDKTNSVNLLVGGEDMGQFFDLHDGSKTLSLPGDGEALVSVGVAELLDISAGDEIVVRNADSEALHLTVSGVFDNHVFNYVIVNPGTYESQLGEAPEYQVAFATVSEGKDPRVVGADFTALNNVMNVTVSEALADQVGSMLEVLDLIVATVIVCAAILAVIVLYNLTNINITERMREIATIKVLGFNSWETALYVFKENLILSIFGALIGLLGGKLLLDFVMSQIKIDMVWFTSRLFATSLLLSVGITVLVAVLVDVVLYYRLEKINMAEALKSAE